MQPGAFSEQVDHPPQGLIHAVYQTLLPELRIVSLDPHHPVVVEQLPLPWQVLGVGNFAAVVAHPAFPDQVIKVYAPGRPGFEEEVEVYQRLGQHPTYSQCLYHDSGLLILQRLHGVTLYDCLSRGIPIPRQVIRDVDEALAYARRRGLYPHDVHGRNVMLADGRGLVVDVSDFLHTEACSAWRDLKVAYYWFYRPVLSPLRVKVPYVLLDWVRVSYRAWRRLNPRQRLRWRLRWR